MLVSPTEPLVLRKLGTVSSIPEKYGADYLFPSPHGLIGVQRKEVKDWVASCFDGRLEKEISQVKALDRPILVLEGQLHFAADGVMMGRWNGKFTRTMHLSLLLSMMSQGWWVLGSLTTQTTGDLLLILQKWLGKTDHQGLSRPKGERNWGASGNRDWGIHLLQGFDGIGKGVAGKIYDHFGGVPLNWTASELDLMEVEGVGKGRAGKLIQALEVGKARPDPPT